MIERIKKFSSWVEEENIDHAEQQRREVVHIVLSAISNSKFLSAMMAMKGGILLAIKYSSPRYTMDIDFSTSMKITDIDIKNLKKELDTNLILSSEKLNYGMACLVQKFKQKPNNSEATWPALEIKIGYADKEDTNSYRRLQKRNSSKTIKIDYSFNEIICNTEELELSDGKIILTYSYSDLIAEKYRAILQQEKKNKSRPQDVYDIYYILTNFNEPDEKQKKEILDTLMKKSYSRELYIDQNSISKPETKKRSEVKYETIKHDIFEELPSFKKAYDFIEIFYKNLPWSTIKDHDN